MQGGWWVQGGLRMVGGVEWVEDGGCREGLALLLRGWCGGESPSYEGGVEGGAPPRREAVLFKH